MGNAHAHTDQWDVCICGAGLAGLTLARQLKLQMPDLNVLLLDKLKRPLPSGTHKVGESLIEVGAHYLSQTLQLEDYLNRKHLPKCSLRFFTKAGSVPLKDRTEFGSLDFPAIPAFQIDRGVLENDLRQMCSEMGIALMEGVSVKDIIIRASDEDHHVKILDEYQNSSTIRAKWVVDATGRRRLLARKLDLRREVGHKPSACWWRLPGKWEISDAVPSNGGSETSDWRERELGRRWYSTNHLMGNGYWVWFIPVASHTSVGIVADEATHPVAARGSIEKAYAWLEKHEPHIAKWLKGVEPHDFLALKHFSHTSSQFYSVDRWAMTGEAAIFADPYYSTGSDLIALQNNVVTRMIRKDLEGDLTQKCVTDYNALVHEVYRGILALYEGQYVLFGSEFYQTIKTLWDYDYLTGAIGKLGFSPHVLDEANQLSKLTRMVKRWSDLNLRIQKLLRDWQRLVPNKSLDRHEGGPIGPRGLITPNVQLFQTFNNLLKMRDAETLIEECEGTFLTFVQARAIRLFKEAIEDLKPGADKPTLSLIQRASEAAWLDPYKISLDPSKWSESGLFAAGAHHSTDEEHIGFFSPAPPEREAAVRSQPCPHELIWSHIEAQGRNTAVIVKGKTFTYEDLGRMAGSVSKKIGQVYGLNRGTVAVIGEPGIEMLATLLGTLTAGLRFIAIPDTGSAEELIQEANADIVVSQHLLNLPVSALQLKYRDLVDEGQDGLPAFKEPSVESRLAPCYSRFTCNDGRWDMRSITNYSMTILCVCQELALRNRMILHRQDEPQPKPVLLSMTKAGQDWLVPLMFGGRLIIPASTADVGGEINHLKSVANEVEGQAVLSGRPEDLMKIAGGLKAKEPILMLAIERALTTEESKTLGKCVTAIVNGGYLTWGHEDLWAEEFKKAFEQAQQPVPQSAKQTKAESLQL